MKVQNDGRVTANASSRPWQPWERNYSGGRFGIRQDGEWTILRVESGVGDTTSSLRDHEAWDLALLLSPKLKARLEELFDGRRKAENALHALTYRQCPTDTLRRIADERDCGPDCERGSGRVHCPMVDREEGCAGYEAEEIRQLADAIGLANSCIERDVLRIVDSCGGSSDGEDPAWSKGYNDALNAVERELKRFFSPTALTAPVEGS